MLFSQKPKKRLSYRVPVMNSTSMSREEVGTGYSVAGVVALMVSASWGTAMLTRGVTARWEQPVPRIPHSLVVDR